jgi:hypothetical protein
MSNTEHRDRLIRIAHTYAFVPEWPTILVKIIGEDNRARRMLAQDALAIARTATYSIIVRRTEHRNRSAETVVTDYRWDDGMRIRLTETCAM